MGNKFQPVCAAASLPGVAQIGNLRYAGWWRSVLGSALVLALLTVAPAARAETVRVATWSFPAAGGQASNGDSRLQEAALALKPLHADVILLEHVRDWQTCRALAQALKPDDYSVLVCSAFHNAANDPGTPPQVAILSKQKGYFSWSEPWRAEGGPAPADGFGFAAIHFAKHRVGFFIAPLDPQAPGRGTAGPAPALPSQQWAQTLENLKSWVANRLDAVVIAGGHLPPDSADGTLAACFLGAPLRSLVTLPAGAHRLKAEGGLVPVGLAADAEVLPGLVLMGPHAACEVDLDAPAPPVAEKTAPKAPAVVAAPKPAGATSVTAQVVAPVSNSVTAQRASGATNALARVDGTATQKGGDTLTSQQLAPRPEPAATTKPSVPAAVPRNPQAGLSHFNAYFLAGGAFAWVAVVGVLGLWARRRRARRAARSLVLPGNAVSSYTLVFSEHSIAGPANPVQSPVPQRAPLPALPESAAGGVEVWPPGPVLLAPELQRAAAPEREGLRAQLAQFLKLKFVQRLLADRSELLKAQHAATGKLLSLEERLARLEQQLHQQNQAYEQRILDLDRDLAAAKEENRELIRARIAQVKAEMENARARLMAQARAEKR